MASFRLGAEGAQPPPPPPPVAIDCPCSSCQRRYQARLMEHAKRMAAWEEERRLVARLKRLLRRLFQALTVSLRELTVAARALAHRIYDWYHLDPLSVAVARARIDYDRQHNSPEQRAARLLDSLLTPEQREQYAREGFFKVRGKSGLMYEIHRDIPTRNVYVYAPRELYGREGARSLCVHLTDWDIERKRLQYNEIVDDRIIAQLLMIQTNDKKFANMSC